MSRTALPLPQLLASLPQSGKRSLIRPTSFPPTSFYRVTRSKLRFTPTSAESETLKAHGRAYGLLFWKGKAVAQSDEEIRGGLKHLWTTVDDSQLDAGLKEVVESAEKGLKQVKLDKKQVLEGKRRAKKERLAKAAESLV
ncbi:hypothetical protein P7C73_g5828, partial [Tremellales sp. Uapishka_1]